MAGQYWCNGEIPNCQNKKDCYKDGGFCRHTTDVNYAGGRPEITRKYSERTIREPVKSKGIFTGCVVPALVSIIAAFATTLIIILAKMS